MKNPGFLSILFTCCYLYAKAVTVSGTVTDDQHQPVPFCSIYIKGTTIGTTANIDGNYSLEVAMGSYEIVFRSIGFKLYSKNITVEQENLKISVELVPETYQLKEAVVNASAEDPAYAIMRKAIKMRKHYMDEVDAYTCKAYVKSTQKLINYPKKFLGQDVDFGDMLDTTTGIFYLSESVSGLSYKKAGKVKEEMVSSKVSGDSRSFSFNKSYDLLVNFYQNLISMGNLSPRGIVSPVSASAMMYYDYRLEGTFTQYGETVNKIKVIPKRKHDPVFTGDIYILDDSWRIHSLDLFISKDQQIEFIDTFRVRETYVPVEKDKWMMLNSEFDFEFSLFGFHGKGIILGVFSNYNIHPDFPPHYFDNEVLKINRDANKKDTVYWEQERPVPLTLEENRDYVKRDSVFAAHDTREYMDSVDEKNNKFKLSRFILGGYTRMNTFRNSSTSFSGLTEDIQFNTVEGTVFQLTARYSRQRSTEDRRNTIITVKPRYGFSNRHLNGTLSIQRMYNPSSFSGYLIRGGSEVSDFNGSAFFSPLVNTGYTLLAKRNWLKLYERQFISLSHRMEAFNGFRISVIVDLSERLPLTNTTNYSWSNAERTYLSNDPRNPANDSNSFVRNRAFTTGIVLRYRIGQKYITRPEGKSVYTSKFPELEFNYRKAIPSVAGAVIDFDFIRFVISDQIRFGLFGLIRYNLAYGNFIHAGKMEFMDYHHFNGNKTLFSDFSLRDFELLDYYRFATNREFVEAHGEYNLGGLILNKIPVLRNLKLNEIIGAHYFYARYTGTSVVKNYYETSFGIEKFGLLRADFVLAFDDGKQARTGIVIGLKVKMSGGAVRVTE